MNEKKPKWRCPVCNKTALNDNLLIDGFFMELIVSPRLPDDEHEIVLHNDASWDPLPPRKVRESVCIYQGTSPMIGQVKGMRRNKTKI